jgi:hypothetical protein
MLLSLLLFSGCADVAMHVVAGGAMLRMSLLLLFFDLFPVI